MMVAVCVLLLPIRVQISSSVLCCGGSRHWGCTETSLKGIGPLYLSAYYNGPDLANMQVLSSGFACDSALMI